MEIKGLEAWPVEMPLTEPYTIAYETIDRAVNVFLRIETNTAICGYGCAAPDLAVTGETPQSVLTILNEFAGTALKRQDPLRLSLLLEKLQEEMRQHPSALAALDMALYDILGKVANLPLYKLLGGYRPKILTSITIGIMPAKEARQKAIELVGAGFRCLKIKGGTNVDEDIERLALISRAVGDSVPLLFDANQGFAYEDALRFAEFAETIKLELIEQPLPREQWEQLGDLTKRSAVPIAADESLMSAADAFEFARNKTVDIFNVKLMKVGGLNEALSIAEIGRVSGQGIMVGCMDESALAIAAGLHYALSRREVCYADLDGHFDLLNDPASGAVILEEGYLRPQDQPGLGMEIRMT